ncbi:MAG: glycosyltransferase family 4 protein [Pseudomonadales bacterium]|nr:glycosyltransferase family 4 protein [Pseudomonadales bacterium]
MGFQIMHILFLTDNFPPEGNAPASRTFEHARVWAGLGHRVTVITCAPNFPEGIVYEGYRNEWWKKEQIEGIEVLRVKTYISKNAGFFRRILDFQSFMLSGFFAGLMIKNVDVIVATSPQFFTACAGWALSTCKRKPFVFELRDLWPASISALGAIKNTMLLRMLERIEIFLYQHSRKIVTVTHQFKQELIARGIDGHKISTVLNGVDLNSFGPRKKDPELTTKLSLKDKFVVGYIGTHGMAHALETIIKSAESLQHRDDIVFLFAGGGAKADEIKSMAEEKRLPNVRVIGRQEKKLMPEIWSLCDVSVVHLKNTDLFSKVIPSKIFESMAMGLPIIIGVPKGEATTLVDTEQAGIVIEPEQPEQLTRAILRLKDDPNLVEYYRQKCVVNAHNYDRQALALKMLTTLESIEH